MYRPPPQRPWGPLGPPWPVTTLHTEFGPMLPPQPPPQYYSCQPGPSTRQLKDRFEQNRATSDPRSQRSARDSRYDHRRSVDRPYRDPRTDDEGIRHSREKNEHKRGDELREKRRKHRSDFHRKRPDNIPKDAGRSQRQNGYSTRSTEDRGTHDPFYRSSSYEESRIEATERRSVPHTRSRLETAERPTEIGPKKRRSSLKPQPEETRATSHPHPPQSYGVPNVLPSVPSRPRSEPVPARTNAAFAPNRATLAPESERRSQRSKSNPPRDITLPRRGSRTTPSNTHRSRGKDSRRASSDNTTLLGEDDNNGSESEESATAGKSRPVRRMTTKVKREKDPATPHQDDVDRHYPNKNSHSAKPKGTQSPKRRYEQDEESDLSEVKEHLIRLIRNMDLEGQNDRRCKGNKVFPYLLVLPTESVGIPRYLRDSTLDLPRFLAVPGISSVYSTESALSDISRLIVDR